MLIYEPQTENTVKIYSDDNFYVIYNGYYRDYVVVNNDTRELVQETDIALPSLAATPTYFVNKFVPEFINITQEQVDKAYEIIYDVFNYISDDKIYDLRFLIKDWVIGKEYQTNQKVRFNNFIYEVRKDHTSYLLPNEDLENYRCIDKPLNLIEYWRQGNLYNIGDKVHIGEHYYESVLDNNIWSPLDFPVAWKLLQ